MPGITIGPDGWHVGGVLFEPDDIATLTRVADQWIDEPGTVRIDLPRSIMAAVAPWIREAYDTPTNAEVDTAINEVIEAALNDPAPQLVGQMFEALVASGVEWHLAVRCLDRLAPIVESVDANADARGRAYMAELVDTVAPDGPDAEIVNAAEPSRPDGDRWHAYVTVEREIERVFDGLAASSVPAILIHAGIRTALEQARAALDPDRAW